MYDLIIENGRIIDGSGKPAYEADLGISEDKIVQIGDLKSAEAQRKINAGRHVVAPGFIDIHSHSDSDIFLAPCASNKLMQGVTTEVVGQCGYSLYPIRPEKLPIFHAVMAAYNKKIGIDWLHTSEFFAKLDVLGLGINLAPLMGHGAIRMNVLGFEARKAADVEIEQMKILVDEAMQDGAFGLSTGLGYPPGCFADTKELIELSKIVAKHGGVYTSHLRDQGDFLLESVQEAISVGEQSGVAVNISHLKASGKKNWGKIKEAIELIDAARQCSVDVIYDFYPYTSANNSLSSELPLWLNEGGMSKFVERLASPEVRAKVQMAIPDKDVDYWSVVTVSDVQTAKNKVLRGKTIVEIAELRGKTPFDTVCDLIIEEQGAVEVISRIMCEEDVCLAAEYPFAAVGSDGFALGEDQVEYTGHPRNFGTFPRYIKKYIREKGVITLEDGVRKLTSLPAEFIGVKDRGILAEGKYADIVIFDAEKIADQSTYENPAKNPTGINYVIINGQVQIQNGENNHLHCGRLLRKGR